MTKKKTKGPKKRAAVRSLDTLGKHFPSSKANIEGDELLTASHKQSFVQFIAGSLVATDSPEEVGEKVRKYMAERVSAGEYIRKPIASANPIPYYFGRVTSEESFRQVLWKQRPAPHWSMVKWNAYWDNYLLTADVADQAISLEKVFLGPQDRIMWVWFGKKNPHNPYQGLKRTRDELVRRMGLTHYNEPDLSGKKPPLVTWVHEVPPGHDVRLPTAWDARLHEQWRTGGKTLPIGDSTTKNGLWEAVHPVITGKCLCEAIARLSEVAP